MRSRKNKPTKSEILPSALPKCPSGIHGLDEITLGGLPRGRPTLVRGGAGCGKTLLGMEFLVRGATEFNEPGVCFSFEESADELAANVPWLGFDVAGMVARKKLAIDHIYLERSLIEEAGEYDLERSWLARRLKGSSSSWSASARRWTLRWPLSNWTWRPRSRNRGSSSRKRS